MEEYHSQVNKSVLLGSHFSEGDFDLLRGDVSEEDARLQLSLRKLPQGFAVSRHRHLQIERETLGTSEIWIVLRGSVRATVFDIDNSPVESFEVKSGELAIFHEGGHELECLEEDTLFVEVKNGPYFGRERDKIEF